MKYIHHVFLTTITVLLLATVSSNASANLINLYNWTSIPGNSSYPSEVNPVHIISSNSAQFDGSGYSHADSFFYGFAGNITTSVGAYYEVTFTFANASFPQAFASMSFGNFSADLTSAINTLNPNPKPSDPKYSPANFDFILLATDQTTSMNFFVDLDLGGGANLSNFSVTEVPEPNLSFLLFGVSVTCLLAFSRHWQQKA